MSSVVPAAPATLVDSCVILDVATGDAQWADWSANRIAEAMDTGRVVINQLIYAETSVGYETVEELDEILPASDYEREPLPSRAGFTAGKAYLRYRRSGGDKRSHAGPLHRRARHDRRLRAANPAPEP